MKIIIINLAIHLDRKNDIIQKMNNISIKNYTFFNAIDGNHLENYNFVFKPIPKWKSPFKNRPITVGEIGCALSHYSIWKYIVDNNIDKVLILEDDVEFTENFIDIYNKIQDVNIDLLYIGRNPLNIELNLGDENEINNLMVKAKTSYNAHSYIITYECAKKLINSNFLDFVDNLMHSQNQNVNINVNYMVSRLSTLLSV